MEMKEWYQNREDMLELKHINKITGLNVDYFKPGHPQALRGAWTPSLGQGGSPGWGPHVLLRAASMAADAWWEEPASLLPGFLGGKQSK